MRTRTLNDGWEFYFDGGFASGLPSGGQRWQPVTLPHDWQIWHVKDLYADGIGWYRRTLLWQPPLRCCLYFEGVYMDSEVFVNGTPAAQWKYGYSSFQVDVTPYLKPGQNEVLVRCCLRHPNSRWYSGAGIYRDVWRLDYPDSHLVTDGLYVSAKEQPDGWRLTAQAETEAASVSDQIEYTLLDAEGAAVGSAMAAPGDAAVLTVQSPRLWDLDDPYCYRLRASLIRGGRTLDELESVCGFRTLELSADRGFFLNHRHVVLHGVALHHDLGCLGAAFSLPAARRQLEIMKDMGVNALRTSHNMPAPGILELADRMGLLVIDEAFDCWRGGKTPYDYARFFDDWYRADVASWVRRDRNHPSLLFWSIGNEIYDTHRDETGRETMCALLAEVARHDPAKNGLTTLGSNYMAWENTQKCAGLLDAVGYNYGENLYGDHHRAHPDWVIYGSETASIVQSRGVYHFPLSQPLLVDDDLQCSSLGNSRTSWGAKSHQACLEADESCPYTLGQFLWSGIDYIGEPTPYHTKNSYFGLADTAGFPKDAYFAYQAGWHRWQEKPVLHLLPYWDFNPGQRIDVCVFSNLPQVELLVNGVSQGIQTLRGGSDIQTHWQVPYAPGFVEAVGYDDCGRIVARVREESFSDGVKLNIEADRARIAGDGRDLVFCTVTVCDSQGRPVRNANNAVTVRVTGPLKLVGLDNGNSVDMDEYKTDRRQLFSGKLLAVAAGCGQGGVGCITVSGPGLESASVRVDVRPDGKALPVLPEISESTKEIPVPVRKIELRADASCLTAEAPRTVIRARVFPAGAAFKLTWRVMDDHGVTVPNVKLEPVDGEENAVRATGVGDGSVRIRCLCGYILSDLELEVTGLGSLYLNPYEFVCAALYNHSQGDIGNGNERGIATSRTGRSWVAYDKLDFGPAGADTLTSPIFEMAGMPTPVRFWKGIPYAPGSKMIGERIYDKPTTWNVYKEETFKLDEPLTGRDVFGIELQCKVHIKGFAFLPRTRAWDRIGARDFDCVYGDRYTATEEAVEGIGNNVSLIFRGQDFGESGLRGVAIRGKSRLENNTIHLRFEGDGEPQRRVVEFPGCGDWQEVRFPLEPVRGRQDVTFLFLPGCDFDFQSFQFFFST